MRYCGLCGARSDGWERFCTSCGAPLRSTDPGPKRTSTAPDRRGGRRKLVTVAAAVVVLAVAVSLTYVVARSGGGAGRQAGGAPPRSTTPGHPVPTFAALYHADASGVIRIDATTCSGSGVGSGVLIAPTLVVTAAHVVTGAAALGLSNGSHTVVGHVIGIDAAADVALVRAAEPLRGHQFTFAGVASPVGTSVGVIGYPEGGPVSFSTGTISGLDRTVDVAGRSRSNLIQTDAPLNPGNSGGPLLLVDGRVVGIADAANDSATGIGYAVPSSTVTPLVSRWRARPAPPSPPGCRNPLGPSTFGGIQGADRVPAGIVATLTTYFDAIDSGDYHTAYEQLSPAEQANGAEATFAARDATSYDYEVAITGAQRTPSGTELVDVTFTSLQSAAQGPNGDQCDHWKLEYAMVDVAGSWMIQAASGQGGATHASC